MKEAKEQIKKILESAEEFMHYVPNCQKLSMTVTPEFFDSLKVAYKVLEDKEWIPVSERLPKKDGGYLVAIKDRDYIEISWFYFDDKKWSYRNDDIVAWTYMPEPYKGGEA